MPIKKKSNGPFVLLAALATGAHVLLAGVIGYMSYLVIDMVIMQVTVVLILLIYLSNVFAKLYLSISQNV